MTNPLLSIIIPAHNEEDRLPPSLLAVSNFLSRQEYSSEILVVENGSNDRTFEIAQSFLKEIPGLMVIQEQNAGKGLAVRRGMLAAQGEYRIFVMPIFQCRLKRFKNFCHHKSVNMMLQLLHENYRVQNVWMSRNTGTE